MYLSLSPPETGQGSLGAAQSPQENPVTVLGVAQMFDKPMQPLLRVFSLRLSEEDTGSLITVLLVVLFSSP
ncbi:hypothetical protein SAMN05443144_12221 [Fodinibius roseus]|uniref:Uncharacterized protein n=1 Tax=Fodinibius roseus TaxID=1194090 RepID=A0A1M5I4Y1_9BACT|nr:hypothetical protein SAMN05443144_12221 [Fodinibius roseus]